jgi:hypothetical protein
MDKKPKASNSLEEDVNTTVMALREALMDYFKGDTIRDLHINKRRLHWTSRGVNVNRTADRLENEIHNPRSLQLSGLEIFRVYKEPDELLILSSLDRSPELKAVAKGVKEFMSKYLTGVKVTTKKFTGTTKYKDRELIVDRNNEPQLDTITNRLRYYQEQIMTSSHLNDTWDLL